EKSRHAEELRVHNSGQFNFEDWGAEPRSTQALFRPRQFGDRGDAAALTVFAVIRGLATAAVRLRAERKKAGATSAEMIKRLKTRA
ncbi:MAG: hypothetical protein P4L57_10625, partial [Rhizomicrobium sp.]|nr:hypothetical protein [Rhizomicrobium sp.]